MRKINIYTSLEILWEVSFPWLWCLPKRKSLPLFSHPLAWLRGTILMGRGWLDQMIFWGGLFHFLMILWSRGFHGRALAPGGAYSQGVLGGGREGTGARWIQRDQTEVFRYFAAEDILCTNDHVHLENPLFFPPGPLRTLHAPVVAPACWSLRKRHFSI